MSVHTINIRSTIKQTSLPDPVQLVTDSVLFTRLPLHEALQRIKEHVLHYNVTYKGSTLNIVVTGLSDVACNMRAGDDNHDLLAGFGIEWLENLNYLPT